MGVPSQQQQVPKQTQSPQDNSVPQFDEELVREQLARNIAFLGEEGVEKLRNSFVVIVGAGGVGSWAASMLIRSGVGKIRIIDFDQVSLSSLNRHATAVQADVGTPKVIAMKKAFRQVAPWVQVDARVELFQEDSAEELLSGNPDYVVDAIDNINTKLALLKFCYDHKIPVMSSMGAGAKADPSRIQISDISETFEDPLARAVRRKIKKMGVDTGIDVVYSTEKPHHVKLLPLDETQAQEADEYAALPDFRSRILPVLGPLPAMFGMAMATFITCKIGGWPMDPLPIKLRDGLYQRIHRDLKVREGRLDPEVETIALDRRDVGYVIEEVWRGKSAISKSMDKIGLCRWKRSEPLTVQNVILLTKSELDRHVKLPLDADLVKEYGQEVVDFVESRFKEEAEISRLR
ncbi:MAG: ubiquitin--protein ligase molybdopterin-converting factor [Podila humilis]|nr:MAG: ubiquitin--protein ligase molybdopterin-converting factor [Podila humilis]